MVISNYDILNLPHSANEKQVEDSYQNIRKNLIGNEHLLKIIKKSRDELLDNISPPTQTLETLESIMKREHPDYSLFGKSTGIDVLFQPISMSMFDGYEPNVTKYEPLYSNRPVNWASDVSSVSES